MKFLIKKKLHFLIIVSLPKKHYIVLKAYIVSCEILEYRTNYKCLFLILASTKIRSLTYEYVSNMLSSYFNQKFHKKIKGQ